MVFRNTIGSVCAADNRYASDSAHKKFSNSDLLESMFRSCATLFLRGIVDFWGPRHWLIDISEGSENERVSPVPAVRNRTAQPTLDDAPRFETGNTAT